MAQQGRRARPGKARRHDHLPVPGVRLHHHRPGQGRHAARRPVAVRPAGRADAQERGLLDEHPLLPVHLLLGHRAGVHEGEGRPGPAAQLCQFVAGRTVGGHQAQDQRRDGDGAPDRPAGLGAACLGQATDRRHRRAGKLPVLDHPGLGRLHDQPERGARAGPLDGRGRADHEHRVPRPGRRVHDGRPRPDGQRRPDRRRLQFLHRQHRVGAALQGRVQPAGALPHLHRGQGRQPGQRPAAHPGGRRQVQGHDRRPDAPSERQRVVDGPQGL